MLTAWIDTMTPCLKDVRTGEIVDTEVIQIKRAFFLSFRPEPLAGPYFKADIPKIRIDYKGLTAYARKKGKRVCDLSDSEKNLFIVDADMNVVRRLAIKQ